MDLEAFNRFSAGEKKMRRKIYLRWLYKWFREYADDITSPDLIIFYLYFPSVVNKEKKLFVVIALCLIAKQQEKKCNFEEFFFEIFQKKKGENPVKIFA